MEQVIINQLPPIYLGAGSQIIKKGLDAGNIRTTKRPRKTVDKVKTPNKKKYQFQERIEKAVDKMLKQGALYESATKSYNDTNPNYIIGENGKRLRGYQIRKMKKAGLLPA
nr:MAG TPA: hypothetical protein [Caudoviricetes sp.]